MLQLFEVSFAIVGALLELVMGLLIALFSIVVFVVTALPFVILAGIGLMLLLVIV